MGATDTERLVCWALDQSEYDNLVMRHSKAYNNAHTVTKYSFKCSLEFVISLSCVAFNRETLTQVRTQLTDGRGKPRYQQHSTQRHHITRCLLQLAFKAPCDHYSFNNSAHLSISCLTAASLLADDKSRPHATTSLCIRLSNLQEYIF